MKRPTWATIVGILGIVFGCFGILGGGQQIFMPKMMEMQKEMLEAFEETATQQHAKKRAADSNDSDAGPNESIPFPGDIFKPMQKMLDVPNWFAPWSVFSELAKIFISAVYLSAAILLLQTKPASIRLFY